MSNVVDIVPILESRGLLAPNTPKTSEDGAGQSGPVRDRRSYWRVFTENEDLIESGIAKVRDGAALMAPLDIFTFESEDDIEEGLLSLAEFAHESGVITFELMRAKNSFAAFAIKYPFLVDLITSMKPGSPMIEPLVMMLCGSPAEEVQTMLDRRTANS